MPATDDAPGAIHLTAEERVQAIVDLDRCLAACDAIERAACGFVSMVRAEQAATARQIQERLELVRDGRDIGEAMHLWEV